MEDGSITIWSTRVLKMYVSFLRWGLNGFWVSRTTRWLVQARIFYRKARHWVVWQFAGDHWQSTFILHNISSLWLFMAKRFVVVIFFRISLGFWGISEIRTASISTSRQFYWSTTKVGDEVSLRIIFLRNAECHLRTVWVSPVEKNLAWSRKSRM